MHRYFPSKSDIVLKPVEGTFVRIAQRLDEHAASIPPLRAIRTAVTDILTESADDWTPLRTALRLIAATPELNWAPQVRAGDGSLRAFLVDRTTEPASSPIPDAVAAAVSAMTVSALIWWALQDDSDQDPRSLVDGALAGLEPGYARYF